MHGITIRDMHELGISYSDITSREGYRVTDLGEVVVVRLSNMKVLRSTGKHVGRIRPTEAPKVQRERARREYAKPVEVPEFNPLKGVANPRPKDTSGWKGTRKRRSCVTKHNAYDSAEGCIAIGAMFARR